MFKQKVYGDCLLWHILFGILLILVYDKLMQGQKKVVSGGSETRNKICCAGMCLALLRWRGICDEHRTALFFRNKINSRFLKLVRPI